ncbi:hypothetical protein F8M41_001744 [Gigaspora margarita]|uniref:Uncharacterized protein n=1 Tax=Gigaspora margarita TaxID=4874 RepID=A0A8H3XFF5_GIGMA|nr:hypothetical protein F8M41_001744 [Gigaspora margarita]
MLSKGKYASEQEQGIVQKVIEKGILFCKSSLKILYETGAIETICKDESSSSESFAESSLLLTNKQTTSVTLSNKEFRSAPPMNESDFLAIEDNTQQPFNTINIDDNDTQQNSGKNTIKANTIEADDNDTQQYSGSQVISDNTLNNSILKSKKIIEKKKSNHLTCSTRSKTVKNGLSKKVAVVPKKQATSNKSKKIKYQLCKYYF